MEKDTNKTDCPYKTDKLMCKKGLYMIPLIDDLGNVSYVCPSSCPLSKEKK